MQYKKIPYIELIPIILITIILVRIVYNIENVGEIIGNVLSLISYFIWGFAIAYLLNPLMVYLEKKTKLKRQLSIALIYTIFTGIIILIIVLATPSIVKSFVDLFNNLPYFIDNANKWLNTTLDQNPILNKNEIIHYIQSYLTSFLNNANDYLKVGVKMIMTNIINAGSILIKLFSGIIISIYLLKDKEIFILNIKKFILILFSENKTIQIIEFGRKVNLIFKKYVIGKLLDSIIIGFLCFISLLLLNIPYALMIGLIVGIFNMIPYFGNIISMVPACIITLFFSPFKSLEVAIVILILNSLDGWLISPKILGDSVGLNPLLIILGIAIGGGLYGILGMFLGVPVVAILKTIVEDYINKNIKNKPLDILKQQETK